jgi:hypothetical protein
MQPILDLLKPGACRVDEPDGQALQKPVVPAQAPQRPAESKHNRLEDYTIRYPMTPAYLPPLRPGLGGQVFCKPVQS